MAITTLYQTKSSKIISGTELIFCTSDNQPEKDEPWLGDGYYFWDTLEANAHWWGRVHYQSKYTIVELVCNMSEGTCYDLFGNLGHISEFEEIRSYMIEEGLADSSTRVCRILEFIKQRTDFLEKYKSIRGCGYNVKNGLYKFVCFSTQEGMPLAPKVQVCLLSKDSYEIISKKVIFHLQ